MAEKTICIVTGTRAEYGLLRPLIDRLQKDSYFELCLVVTGSHLNVAFGETWHEIEDDGFPIHAKIEMELDSDTHGGMARATGKAMLSFTDYFEANRPDMLVVLGDRYELLAVVIAASMLRIPIAHIGGGDTSEGAIDEFIRHSITKMSYLHFASNEQSQRRIVQLGESPKRVLNVGALNVDNILSRKLLSRDELCKELNFDFSGQYALVTYHPVTMNDDISEFNELLKAVDMFPDMVFLFTKANADSGGRTINDMLDSFARERDNCAAYASLGSQRYLSAMKYADVVVGNSSSGLYETPSFGVPCVNIGDRQRGRMCAENVLNCTPESGAIASAIHTALDDKFKAKARKVVSPFGDGRAAEKIADILKDFMFSQKIHLQKEFYSLENF